jgi:protocatechuate 3,4-dioxygenase beta subunit
VGAWSSGYDADTHYNIAPALGPLMLELGNGIEVRGVLLDDETGEPLTGGRLRSVLEVEARIFGTEVGLPENQLVEEREVEVGEDGSFLLAGMPSRGFTLIAESPGYVPYRYTRYESRNLEEGRTITLGLKPLEPLPVLVEDAMTEAAAPGARVLAFGGQGILDSAVTDEDGAATLELHDWDGRDPLWVEATDGAGRTARTFLDRKKYAEGATLVLQPAFRVGALVVQDGQPVVGAEVALLGDDARVSIGRTGMDGMVDLRHEPGDADLSELHLQARFLDMQSLPVAIDMEDLPETPVTLDLLEGGWLAGRVVDPFGIPVPSARLSVHEAGQKGHGLRDLSAYSGEDGTFRLGPVRADVAQSLEVRADGFEKRVLNEVLPGDEEMLIHLDPVVEWEGRVIAAATGQPMTSYSVRLLKLNNAAKPTFKTNKARVSRKLDEPGGFSVPLPDPGRYKLRVTVSGHMTTYSEEIVFNGITPPPFAELMVWPAAVLEVTVNDTIGRPVHGYSVAVIPWEAASGADRPDGKVRKKGRTSRTNSQGRVTFNLGEGGGYRVAGGPGVWFENMMLPVTPGPPVKRLYHLPAAGDLEVTIVDENGAPLSDGRVYVRTNKSEKDHSLYRRLSFRNGDHVVFFETLPQALYQVEVRRRNYDTVKQDVRVRGLGTDRVTIEMQPNGSGNSSSSSGRMTLRSR